MIEINHFSYVKNSILEKVIRFLVFMINNDLLFKLPEYIELFLDIWAQKTTDAGYIGDTTAKREDCIQSFWAVVKPMHDYLKSNNALPIFGQLLQNKGDWAETIIGMAQRHRARGISMDRFLGNLAALIHSLEELIVNMDGTAEEKLASINILRKWSDGMNILVLSDWTVMTEFEAINRLAEANRELTLQRNQSENILEATNQFYTQMSANHEISINWNICLKLSERSSICVNRLCQIVEKID